jgi:hypothetical protein
LVKHRIRIAESRVQIPVSPIALVVELVDTHGLGPCAERLAGSNPAEGIKKFMKVKIIILFLLLLFGFLINYQEKNGYFLKIFPIVKNPSFAYFTFSKEIEKKDLFASENFWGWPFAYYEKKQFNLKAFFLNIIFYLLIWLFFLFVIWFIKGMRKIYQRRFRPPSYF